MDSPKVNLWRQRSKSKDEWPKWLRSPRLLRGAFAIGIWLYRLVRFWRMLIELFGG